MLLLQEVEKGEEDIVEVSMSNASLIVSETKASAACMHRHAIWLWLAAHKAGLPALAGLAGAALGTQSKACFADMPLGAAGTSPLHLSSCGSYLLHQQPRSEAVPIWCSYCTAMQNVAELALLL